MQPSEFERELSRYPVVRNRNWKREWNANTSSSSSSSSIDSSGADLNSAKSDDKKWHPDRDCTMHFENTTFWDALPLFLQRYFDVNTAASIFDRFKQDYESSLKQISLDDIEQLLARR